MEIILMRHGKPSFHDNSKITCREMVNWITQYNFSHITDDTPPALSTTLALKASTIISSPLPRAISSLKALDRKPNLIDEVFKEVELPLYPIPGIRLPSYYWAVFFRLLWLCRISHGTESLNIAKKRAARAAKILINLARKNNGPVLLMGHGIMNRLIASELSLRSWKAYRHPDNGYWSATIYKI